jgi:hypothetical protein
MDNKGTPTNDHSDGVVVVRPAAEVMSRQRGYASFAEDLRHCVFAGWIRLLIPTV